MRQLAKFLSATGRRLRALGKVVSHFFRKGKLGLKLAVKIPFFIDMLRSRPIGTGVNDTPRAASVAPPLPTETRKTMIVSSANV